MSAMLFFIEFFDMVATGLAQLGSENSLYMCGEVYGIVKRTILIIVRKLCSTIRST